jgi:chromatin remodeling complex protein RSC6
VYVNTSTQMDIKFTELEELVKKLTQRLTRQEKAFRKLKRSLKPVSEKKPRKPSGFAKPSYMSPELCTFLDLPSEAELARTEVTKRVLNYIKEKELQNKETKRNIDMDEKLEILLQPNGEIVTYFSIQRLLKVHYVKPI